MTEMSLKEYYKENKEWLQEVAQCRDRVVRAMALAILKEGSEES